MPLPDPADNLRQIFRVSVVGSGIDVRIDRVLEGRLLDAHSEGFGVAAGRAAAALQIGQIVLICTEHDGQRIEGRARVQNVIRRSDSTYRLGFAVVPSEQLLRRGLRQMAITVQRERLARLASRR